MPSYDYYGEEVSKTAKAMGQDRFIKQELIKFSIRESGRKNGSIKSVTLSACEDGKALLVFSIKDSYNRPPVENKYMIAKTALSEIKSVFIEYGMYNWRGEKFSDQFIADGASKSYTFIFSDDDIIFSSQTYKDDYALKLNKLNEIIEKYQQK